MLLLDKHESGGGGGGGGGGVVMKTIKDGKLFCNVFEKITPMLLLISIEYSFIVFEYNDSHQNKLKVFDGETKMTIHHFIRKWLNTIIKTFFYTFIHCFFDNWFIKNIGHVV